MESQKKYGYGKLQKLKSRKLIDFVFKEGKTVAAQPLRLFYVQQNEQYTLQAGVGVSKRFFPHAVDRNKIKRVIREAWRLQKSGLENKISKNKKQLSVFINYTGKDLPQKDIISLAMNKCLQKLEKEIFP